MQAFTNKDAVVGTTWPYQVNLLEQAKVPVKAVKPKEGTTGWSDTWMIYAKAQHPNCMYLWMNYIISPEAQAKVAESFGEAPVNPKACALTTDKQLLRKVPRPGRVLVEGRLLLDDPDRGLRRRPR